MGNYFESIKKGAKEALTWKQEKNTGARVTHFTAEDVAKLRKKPNNEVKTII